jgi:hypothetical protein
MRRRSPVNASMDTSRERGCEFPPGGMKKFCTHTGPQLGVVSDSDTKQLTIHLPPNLTAPALALGPALPPLAASEAGLRPDASPAAAARSAAATAGGASGAAASAAPAAEAEAKLGDMRLLGAAAMGANRLGMYPPSERGGQHM